MSIVRGAILGAALALSGVSWANAAETEEPAAPGADEQFAAGQAAFDQGDYATARLAYLEVWNRRRTYDVAANLGQAELEMGLFRDAAEHFSFAIANAPPSVPAETRDAMRALLEQARKEVAVLGIQGLPDGAAVLVDGRAVATAPIDRDLYIEPGKHVVEVDLGGSAPEKRELTGIKGERHSLVFSAPPATQVAGTGSEPLSPEPADPAAGDSSGPSWVPVAVGGTITALGLVGGVGFTLAASSKRDDRDEQLAALGGSSACGSGTVYAAECSKIDQLDSDANQYRNLGVAGFVTAGVAGVATAVYLLWPRQSSSEQAVLVAPAVGRNGGSVNLSGAF